MTKEKGTRYGRGDDELTRHIVKGELEKVMASKVLVDMDSIFDDGTFENAHDSRPLVILVEGALGSGKTTLAYHYCQEWAKGNLTMFNLVALVYLRHPAVHSAGLNMSLDELLLVATSGTDVERDIVGKVAQHVKDGLKFLLILEGWDEAPRVHPNSKYPSDNSFLGKLLLSVSPNTTILITSRPDSSVDLHKRPNVKRVEILGFTKESIHDYFREALSTQLSSDEAVTVECSKLKEHFSKYPAIESSCYIPLNAAILILVYLGRNRTLPTTQYELFYELLLCCIDREVNTCQPNRVLESISSLDDLPHDLKDHLNNICILAYKGIMQDKVVFSEQEVSSLLPQAVQQDLPTMGVLQKVQWVSTRCNRMSYSFSHLSIQELLAAYYISKMEESEQVGVFQTLLDTPRFAAVLQFYAGFTKLAKQGVRKIITGTNFTDVRSSQHSLLSYMRCFYEAQVTDESLFQLRINGKLALSGITLSPLDCMSVGYFLAFNARHSELRVDLSACSLDDHLFGLLVGELSKHIHAGAKAALHEVTERIDNYALGITATALQTNISFNEIGDNGIAHIATALQTNTMKTLDISDCSISDEGAESLARALAVNRSLLELNISFNKIGDNGIAHIATVLQKNTTLRTLDISSCSISDEGTESLARALAVNKSLQELNIGFNEIGDNGIAHIAIVLKTNTTMRMLDISGCSISDEGAESLVAANKSLQELNIGFNEIGNNGIAHIATALKTNTTMRTLDISSCSISDEGAESLARALAVNRSLQELNISSDDDEFMSYHECIGSQFSEYAKSSAKRSVKRQDSRIGENGIAHIATALQTNATMRTLDIGGCDLSEKGVESLAAVLVNTSIETLVLCWSSAHPDTTLEKIGECISNNNLLRKLNLTIIQRLQESHEFLQLVEAGGKKLMQYLKNTNIQQIDFTIKHNIVSFVSTNRVFDALGTAKDTVNLVRRSNGLPDIKLRQLSIQQ